MSKIPEYYDEYSQLVFRYLIRLCGSSDLAEELTQETFYQAIRTSDKFRGDCKPSVSTCCGRIGYYHPGIRSNDYHQCGNQQNVEG